MDAPTFRSPSYLLPVEDTDFLLRDEMRGMRFALEYSKADLCLRDWGIRSTIIVFGSARVPSPEQAAPLIEAARTGNDARTLARLEKQQSWYQAARGLTLTGQVTSWREHDDAEAAAWAAPGVVKVDNRLTIHS